MGRFLRILGEKKARKGSGGGGGDPDWGWAGLVEGAGLWGRGLGLGPAPYGEVGARRGGGRRAAGGGGGHGAMVAPGELGGLLPVKRTIRVIDAQNQAFREQEVSRR